MLSVDKLDLLDNDPDFDGSYSSSYGMCDFIFCIEDSIGHVDNSVGYVCGVGSSFFFQ